MTQHKSDAALKVHGAAVSCRGTKSLLPARRGSSLVELMVSMVVMGVLVSLGVPRFQRSLEQARADVAAANLRAIWSAQRVHWLNDPERNYATSLEQLSNENLLDRGLVSSNATYVYLDPETDPDDPSGFLVKARRVGGGAWTGDISINARGEITTSLTGPNGQIVPASQ